MSKKSRKNILALVAMLVTIFLGTGATTLEKKTSSPHLENPAISAEIWYPVKKVVDGDTIEISAEGKVIKIRLIGLDTPEIVDPRKPVQCFAKEASAEAKKVLTGQSVRIETDPSQDTYDKYGRLLAYVYAPLNIDPKGMLFNKYMIAEGYGHEYTYNLPYKYQKDFKAAESAARREEKGLWAPNTCAVDTR